MIRRSGIFGGMHVQGQGRWWLAGSVGIALFLSLALSVDKLASTVFALFFFAGLWLLVRGRHEKTEPLLRWILIAFAAYFLVGVAAFFLGEQTRLGEKLLGRDIRFLGAVPVYFAIQRLHPSRALVINGLAAGGVIAGLVALLQVAVSPDATIRAAGETISILFGHLCAALALVNLVLAIRQQHIARWFALAGAAGALTGVLLSGTRGAVLTLLLVGGLVFVAWAGRRGRRWAVMLAGLAVLGGVVWMTPVADNLGARFAEGMADIQRHARAKTFLDNFDWPREMPACLDDPGLLDLMLESNAVRSAHQVELRVVKNDPAFAAVGGIACSGQAYLRIRSTGSKRVHVYFPDRSAASDAGGGAFLVRGSGALGFVGNGDYRVGVNTDAPMLVTLDGDRTKRAQHVAVIQPGMTLDIVFVVTSPGEYRFIDGVNSITARGHMWQAALEGFFQAPLLGHGTGAFPVLLQDRAESGLGPWQVVQYDHAHNEALTVAVDRGLAGLLALLAVYGVPLLYFLRRNGDTGMAGAVLVVAFMVSGLTETIFNHSLAITYYCVLVLLLAAAHERSGTARQGAAGSPADNPDE